MLRQARVTVPGFPHHIVQCGHDRQPVFVERRDVEYYLANLQEWKQVYELDLDDERCAFGRSGERQRNSHPVIDGKTGTDVFCAHWVFALGCFCRKRCSAIR
jgi:hypothetical protein